MAFSPNFHDRQVDRTAKHVLLIAAVPFIAVAGFLCMYLLNEIIPFASNDVSAALYMLMLIVFGLSVPYAMLKLGAHETSQLGRDGDKDLELKDIPKDKEDLWDRPENMPNYRP